MNSQNLIRKLTILIIKVSSMSYLLLVSNMMFQIIAWILDVFVFNADIFLQLFATLF